MFTAMNRVKVGHRVSGLGLEFTARALGLRFMGLGLGGLCLGLEFSGLGQEL